MRFIVGALWLLVFSCLAFGQNVSLELSGGNPTTVEVERTIIVKEKQTLLTSLPFNVLAPKGGFGYVWDYPTDVKVKRKGSTLEILDAPKGSLTVSVSFTVVDFDAKKTEDRYGEITFNVGEVRPPEPPTPPLAPTISGVQPLQGNAGQSITITGTNFLPAAVPVVHGTSVTIGGKPLEQPLIGGKTISGIVPVLPGPAIYEIVVTTTKGSAKANFTYTGAAPEPAPIPVAGFRVLIVHETGDTLPQATRAMLSAAAIREYLEAKCVKGPDGKTPERRVIDKDQRFVGHEKHWNDALDRALEKMKATGAKTWFIASDGKTGAEGPLPATVTDFLAVLKKIGG